MASNKFSKQFDSKKEPSTGHAPTGKNSPPPGKGEKSEGKGNPFARKFDGKKQPPKRKGRKRPAGKKRLQKFGQRY